MLPADRASIQVRSCCGATGAAIPHTHNDCTIHSDCTDPFLEVTCGDIHTPSRVATLSSSLTGQAQKHSQINMMRCRLGLPSSGHQVATLCTILWLVFSSDVLLWRRVGSARTTSQMSSESCLQSYSQSPRPACCIRSRVKKSTAKCHEDNKKDQHTPVTEAIGKRITTLPVRSVVQRESCDTQEPC